MKLFTLLALLGAANAGIFGDNAKKNGMGSAGPNLAQTGAQYGGYGGYAQVSSKAQYGGYGGYAQVSSKNQNLAQTGAQYGGYGGYAQVSAAIDERDAPECGGDECVFDLDFTTGEFVATIIDSLDLNKSGGICVREATMLTRRVLKLLGYDKDTIKQHVQMVKDAYETMAAEEIPKDQLLTAMSAICDDLDLLTPEDVVYFIYEISADDQGTVSKMAMKKTLRRLGIRLNKRELSAFLRQLDADGNRDISPEEIDAWVDSCCDDCDDGSCDDGSCDDGSCDDGSCDDGSCDDGSRDDGSCDDGSCDDGSCDGGCDDGDCCDGGDDCDCLEAQF